MTGKGRGKRCLTRASASGWKASRRDWIPCFTRSCPRRAWRCPAARRRRLPLPGHFIRMLRLSFWMSPPPRSIPLRRLRFTVSSMTSRATRPPSIFHTACPPANSATRSPCSARERSSSRVPMRSWFRMRAENILNSGTRRRSIIRHKIVITIDEMCVRCYNIITKKCVSTQETGMKIWRSRGTDTLNS